jgi:hypothetical protein
MESKNKVILNNKKMNSGGPNLKNLIVSLIFLILAAVVIQSWLPVMAGEVRADPALGTFGSRGFGGTRARNEIIIDFAKLDGEFTQGFAQFSLEFSFSYSGSENITIVIPLIGPANVAKAINLTLDGVETKILFSNRYYYFSGNLTVGEHNLIFKFNSNVLIQEIRELNYTIYGPALNYQIDFQINKGQNKEIFIIDSGAGIVTKTVNYVALSWEYFALSETTWGVKWREYSKPSSDDVKCEFEAEVLIYPKEANLVIRYELEFPGFALERLVLKLSEGMKLRATDLGTIEPGITKTSILFDDLITDSLRIQLTIELWYDSLLSIELPRPMNCKYRGDVALFAQPDLIIKVMTDTNTSLISYPGEKKIDMNFIGDYIFDETSELQFEISTRDSTINVEIIDTLQPTFDGFNLETWVMLNFYGTPPSSITFSLPLGTENGNQEKPQLLTDPFQPLPVFDYNWDANLNRLTLWLGNVDSNNYLLGFRWMCSGSNVTMRQLTITEAYIRSYYVVFYSEKGATYNSLSSSGLIRSSYDEVPQKLREKFRSGSSLEIYEIGDEYLSMIQIERVSDLSCEIFFRNWISDTEIDVHQVIRITSKSSVTSTFRFTIPMGISSLDVSGVAAWSMVDSELIVHAYETQSNIMTFTINGKITNLSTDVKPIRPNYITDCKYYTMFGSSADLNLTIKPHEAIRLNPDELPKYFLSAVNTPKAVNVYYSTTPSKFLLEVERYKMDDPPTTVIEHAQITFITSLDGKIAVQVVYMVKNVDQLEMHITLPKGGVVWMVLVGGKTVPVIQSGDVLTITLIRSTLTGENIAFPVEIVYMLNEAMDELEFMIPKADVSILSLKVNVGLPAVFNIIDPWKYNPYYEYQGMDRWKTVPGYRDPGDDLSFDYHKEMSNQLSSVSYDSDVIEPDWVYIGLDELGSTSDVVEIEKLDEAGDETNKISFRMNTSYWLYNQDSNIKFARVSLTQGQYRISNSGNERQITVVGGGTQQIVFDSDSERVFTDVPPIYLQFPKSGQVIRFSAIFIKPNEDSSIILVKGEKETTTFAEFISEAARSTAFLQFLTIFSIILIVCMAYFSLVRRARMKEKSGMPNKHKERKGDRRQRTMKQIKPDRIKAVDKKQDKVPVDEPKKEKVTWEDTYKPEYRKKQNKD